jgi:prevent-host-death family protein
MVETVTTVEARDRFSRLVNRVAYGNETLVITRRGIKLAALIPFNDLVRLMDEQKPRDPDLEWVKAFGR